MLLDNFLYAPLSAALQIQQHVAIKLLINKKHLHNTLQHYTAR